MIRKLKFLGAVLTALCVSSAFGAAAASAAVEFHFEGAPITLTSEQEATSNAFDVQFGEVKCTTAKAHGTTAFTTTETTLTLAPTPGGCTFGGVATTIHMNGCDYLHHVTGGPPYQGTIDILCPAGQEITITGGTKCTVHIPSQTGIGPISYFNIGTGDTREITFNLSGAQNITYFQTHGSGAIGCTTLTSNTGRFTGTTQITGETDNGGAPSHTGIWIQ
jgi:hypothetical protein